MYKLATKWRDYNVLHLHEKSENKWSYSSFDKANGEEINMRNVKGIGVYIYICLKPIKINKW